ncbi:efflux RND transporter permease subunit [Desulfoprunum benzoelyticum]|uniref:Multidrug efflux pump subunit AcrB n=1 Tax=Desulfoprunum benzoelyticum TaxID=1506996 RepID=A0A840UWC6_9BACT|nr:efflux RND transporter permease subunit [Desulfoprunum benzoelyticum]MBB5349136.1 multidrug efflux pump subunit AcrB [Desulfoprunum benzoelyticum]MBM9530626.1 efflux RND transporter permease subunit [Desulfoprunum benzoelyticum]
MIISDTAVKNSTTVYVLALLLIIFGVYSYLALPRESEPDITIPNVFISTEYKGVSPTDIETAITIEIEKKLKGLEGLKKIESVSSEGRSTINVEFVTGTDIDRALQDVKDKVDEAKGDLPSDLEDDPSVFEVNISQMPIIVFSLSGTCGLPCLKEIADDLQDDIEALPGVMEVEINGGLEREIRVEVIPEKLSYYGLTIATLQTVVQSENRNTSGGAIRLGQGRYQLRVPGEFQTPEEIYGLVIGTHKGEPVYLKDVARVADGFKEETSISRLNGRDAVNLAVKKRAGENIITISREVDRIIAERRTAWPQGTEVTKVVDKSRDIETMIADLENNILSGLVLVLIVIFLSMGIRNAILVSLAIPFSMLISFTILYALGITLNMVVLYSLTLALGMLVDNAIVIIENSYRFMQQGAGRVEAAMRATSEVAWPVIGSTVTTIAAFFPMLFWPGIMGEFMRFLPLTLIVTLTSSLFVALVINPAMASIHMRIKGEADRSALTIDEISVAVDKPARTSGRLMALYRRSLALALDRPWSVLSLGFCSLALMFEIWLVVIGLEKPVEFFPEIEPRGFYVNIEPPEGADLDFIDRIIARVELAVAGVTAEPGEPAPSPLQALAPKEHRRPDGGILAGPSDLYNVKDVYMQGVISAGGGASFSSNSPNHVGVRFLDLIDRSESSHLTVTTIRGRLQDIPGAKITIANEEAGPPTGAPINLEISGPDFQVLGRIAREVRDALSLIPSVEDVRDDYVEGIPSVQVNVDRQKAGLFGLTTDMIGFALKTAYNGLNVSSFRQGDDDFDITLQLGEADRRVVDVLHELLLPTPSGETVPLSTVATMTFAGTIGDIRRINNERVVTVKANIDETRTTGPVVRRQAAEFIDRMALPAGYAMKFTGEQDEQRESEDFLTKAFLVALLLIFLTLVAMFNSVSLPFIIMTSVVLSLGGAFLGMALFRAPFGIIMTGVGVISLAGVVVNNAIVLLDYTNKLRQRGYALKEAVLAAGATRLRPVLLTAITTILGLIPMVTGVSFDFHTWSISWVSESSQWWQSMANVVIFGLMMATFLTLIVVPTLYYLLARLTDNRRQFTARLKTLYWKPYARLAGEPRPKGDS